MGKQALSPGDPTSFSRPELVAVTHIHLDLNVNFKETKLQGRADLTLNPRSQETTQLVLDSRDLSITSVKVQSTGQVLEYSLGTPIGTFGCSLTIQLPANVSEGQIISIEYETSSSASALQWLGAEQTVGKRHPYLFSQCQAIHARSMIPCQDTPSAKITYSAEITVPEELTVLMSALQDDSETQSSKAQPGTKVHRFRQPIPMPTYLIAIAVGHLESRQIGPRSRVWSEKELVDLAAFEFDETEMFLETAEALCGPYVWGQYDLLVLPSSFPFGGMENPCITFVTPTLLAGDKSLANVVAHEIAHSWTGNLVTNRTFEDFWLNEGWTVFVERKIKGRIQGEPARHFDAIGGLKELHETVERRGASDPLTCLVHDLRGVDPDDAFSTVPYEKGHTFLYYLEVQLGGAEAFEPFMKAYLDHFKFKSISTDDWRNFLYDYFPGKHNILNGIDWDSWLHKPGMPPHIPSYDTSLSDACTALADRWRKWQETPPKPFNPTDWASLSPEQHVEVLAQLLAGPALTPSKVEILGKTYNLSTTKNCEIRFRWIRIGLKARWEPAIAPALEFVTEQGRMKYVRPIYRDLYDWEEARPHAIATYKQNRASMMWVSAHTVAKDLHIQE
ncbi:leukotriene A-4 hydrolase isoform X1 [Thrips palmi]|uniref:Leukotriene A(4) hydrolase n=1 Tax=Thrips palmi TaxID=161013 RepID=A0A6P8YJF8_THRPL|nr:leukotriene A-4 hydrolase isoform X1 [Thrips palmi]